MPDVQVEVLTPDTPRRKSDRLVNRAQRRGSFLFTHFGFSGPAVLDVSRTITQHPRPKTLQLTCDFVPHLTVAELRDQIGHLKGQLRKALPSRLLQDWIPRRLAEQLVLLAEVDPQKPVAELSAKTLEQMVDQAKRCTFPINGTLGFEKAEVTAGGINLDEVESSTLQSKLVKGLYFGGEILDLDGPIGGYNFQSAFSTGWLAGQHA